METFALYSYLFSAGAFFLLFCFSLLRINKNTLAIPIVVAIVPSLIWACFIVYALLNDKFYIQDTFPVESIRNIAWYFLLSVLISKQQFDQPFFLLRNSWQALLILVLTVCVVILESFSGLRYLFQQIIGFDFRLSIHIAFALIGLMLVEQLYRNAVQEQRWAIKFLCLGLATIFVIDFILYSKSLLFKNLDSDFWQVRGMINGLVTPLIAASFIRLSKEDIHVHLSKKVVFHTTVLLCAGIYLLLMSLAGYYLKHYGGSWGAVLQISFTVLAIILLLMFFISGKIRAIAKVYFGKHVFQHRYDYRDEWLKLSKKIAKLDSIEDISSLIVSSMASFVDSSGGGLWVKNEQGDYFLMEELNLGNHSYQLINNNEPIIDFLKSKRWVIDFVEYFSDPDMYAGAELGKWHAEIDSIWLIVPLFKKNELEAIVVLTQPRIRRQIDWEDHDLLKTVGMQLVNALVLTKITDDLTRSRQFEAYNRFSAFLVHDLKNLVAQISLIVKNSEKHKRNPEFIDDSIETLENVVKKVDHLLAQLKKGNINNTNIKSDINLLSVLQEVKQQQAMNRPQLIVKMMMEDCWVSGQKQQMIAILGHLVQNAQEATDDNGRVVIEVTQKEGAGIFLKISDNGCGMDEKFIHQRLFKPFDTTKGNAGMGIGVYEAQQYIQQQSGTMTVESQVNKGTTFTINLPSIRQGQ